MDARGVSAITGHSGTRGDECLNSSTRNEALLVAPLTQRTLAAEPDTGPRNPVCSTRLVANYFEHGGATHKVSLFGMSRRCRILLAIALTAVLSGCGSTRPAVDAAAPSPAKDELSTERMYRVPSGSMEPTLGVGARVIFSPGPISVGEIVVFYPPEVAELQECGPTAHVIKVGGAACAEPVPTRSTVKFIKRIVAGPGDNIYIREGHVYRRAAGSRGFVLEPDQYIRSCGMSPECNFPTPIKISAGHWYMLGDNRGESDDSRFFGAVPASWIVGTVTACAPRTAYRTTFDQQMGMRACKLLRTDG